MSRTTGIEIRHARGCPARTYGDCGCRPTFQANVWSARDKRRIRKSFPTISAAKKWRQDAQVALRRGTMRAPTSTTLRQAADAWLAGAEEGTIRTRAGRPYKPSVIRSYRQGLRDHVLPELGAVKLHEIERRDLQDLADRLVARGLDPSTVRNAIAPVRCVYRRTVARGELAVNPTAGLELAAPQGRRDRIADPSEAAALIAALRPEDRPVWATAAYAGLRVGELMALRVDDVDLAAGVIRVERAWDPKAGEFVEPKSKAGRRSVPIPAVLRSYLAGHKLGLGRSEGLMFGRSADRPLDARSLVRRAATAWKNAKPKPLEGIGLHECRHTYASLMIAAGVNAKALSTYLGHASISITLDRYGHLFPGNEDEAAALLDAYLGRASEALALGQEVHA